MNRILFLLVGFVGFDAWPAQWVHDFQGFMMATNEGGAD